jgi:hypothetical protein
VTPRGWGLATPDRLREWYARGWITLEELERGLDIALGREDTPRRSRPREQDAEQRRS